MASELQSVCSKSKIRPGTNGSPSAYKLHLHFDLLTTQSPRNIQHINQNQVQGYGIEISMVEIYSVKPKARVTDVCDIGTRKRTIYKWFQYCVYSKNYPRPTVKNHWAKRLWVLKLNLCFQRSAGFLKFFLQDFTFSFVIDPRSWSSYGGHYYTSSIFSLLTNPPTNLKIMID